MQNKIYKNYYFIPKNDLKIGLQSNLDIEYDFFKYKKAIMWRI